ncbi:ThiF family adenylyltransferase [Streptomyces sp. URMC 123]|uniref:ThiF family adenylyltransferase n=1 Tax=Streptomyces sp. URMC 123 TaxID=3423403 RepID=UPI003F1CCBE0
MTVTQHVVARGTTQHEAAHGTTGARAVAHRTAQRAHGTTHDAIAHGGTPRDTPSAIPDHPALKPALRRGWRDRQTLQLGVTAAHAVTLGPVDTATASLLDLLDGTRGMPLLRREAHALGLPDGHVDALMGRLAAAGVLEDSPGRSTAPDRLRPDLASLSVLHPEAGAPSRLLAARRRARVRVRGTGRLGTAIATALSAAGVGQVDTVDGGCVEPWDTHPAGLPTTAVGERRDAAARRAVREAAAQPCRAGSRRGDDSSAGSSAGAAEPGLALTVLAPRDGLAAYAPDPLAAEPLMASGTPHLYAGVIEATGVVGPLVLPGESACAGCLELERTEREPWWPLLLAQWRSGRSARRAGVPAGDTALTSVVAGLAAAHALSFLDGRPPVSVGGRLEVALPDLITRPSWISPSAHCSCGASEPLDAVTAAATRNPPPPASGHTGQ